MSDRLLPSDSITSVPSQQHENNLADSARNRLLEEACAQQTYNPTESRTIQNEALRPVTIDQQTTQILNQDNCQSHAMADPRDFHPRREVPPYINPGEYPNVRGWEHVGSTWVGENAQGDAIDYMNGNSELWRDDGGNWFYRNQTNRTRSVDVANPRMDSDGNVTYEPPDFIRRMLTNEESLPKVGGMLKKFYDSLGWEPQYKLGSDDPPQWLINWNPPSFRMMAPRTAEAPLGSGHFYQPWSDNKHTDQFIVVPRTDDQLKTDYR